VQHDDDLSERTDLREEEAQVGFLGHLKRESS
jgi:hypothetical protein